jgi:DNA ligase (NAD+)
MLASMVAQIRLANEAYHVRDSPIMTDLEYDHLIDRVRSIDANHPVLREVGGRQGVGVSKASKAQRLPHTMGSLRKIKEDDVAISRWKDAYSGQYVVSDKLDGISALFCCSSAQFRLYKSGDGIDGFDISSLMREGDSRFFPKNLNKTFKGSKSLAVRGELIISRKDFGAIPEEEMSKKTARTVVAGIVNSKSPHLSRWAGIVQFVAFEVIHPVLRISAQLELLQDAGYKTVKHVSCDSSAINSKALLQIFAKRKSVSEFDMDGLVVRHDGVYPPDEHPNYPEPRYSFAFKPATGSDYGIATVTGIEWNLSKDNLLIPVVLFEPVNIAGIVIRRATGINARFIRSNGIGVGASVRVVHSGDVIPKIEAVTVATEPGFPQEGTYEWDDSDVHIRAIGRVEELLLRKVQNFFKVLEVDGLGPSMVERLHDNTHSSERGDSFAVAVHRILTMNVNDMRLVLGPTISAKLRRNMDEMLENVTAIRLIKASSLMGRGVGEKKMAVVLDAFPDLISKQQVPSVEQLKELEGIQLLTAVMIHDNLPHLHRFLETIQASKMSKLHTSGRRRKSKSKSKSNSSMANVKVVFTSFRDVALEAQVIALGGVVLTSVSKSTTVVVCKDVGVGVAVTGKIKRAEELGVPVMGVERFRTMYGLR